MGIYISGVKGLPEQVQENKEKIKTIEEEIEGIDFDEIRALEDQVVENTQDINNMEGTIGTQNIAITNLGGRVDDLETKTQDITRQGSMLYIDTNEVVLNADLAFEADATHKIKLNNEDNGGDKIVSAQDSNNYIDFDSSNNLHIMSDGGEYEFSGDQILVNGTPIGGGSMSYITINYSGSYEMELCLSINKDDFPTSGGNLRSYINALGFNAYTKLLPCRGRYKDGGDLINIIGLYATSGDLYVRGYTANNVAYNKGLAYAGSFTIEKITF